MATLTIPNSFIVATTIVAADVNANFTAVKSFAEGLSTGVGMDNDFLTAGHISDSAVAFLGADADMVISGQVFS